MSILTHKEMSSRGGKKTSKKYGKKHYKNMAKLSHESRRSKVIPKKIQNDLQAVAN